MANIETELRTYILADATVAGLIGTRLYYIKGLQNDTIPYATFFMVSDPDLSRDVGDDGSEPRFQFDIVGSSMLNAIAIDKAIRTRIKDYSGTLTTLTVYDIVSLNRRDILNTDDISSVQRDYIVKYKRG